MKIRFNKDNMDYGTVGDPIDMDCEGTVMHIGDMCAIRTAGGSIVNCMVVLPEWNHMPTYMGLGQLGFNEEIISVIPYTQLKVGDKYQDCLKITES